MASIVPDLLELMPDTLTCQPGTVDHEGAWVASGAALAMRCRIQIRNRIVRDSSGQEVVSSMQVFVGSGSTALDPVTYRFTLPSDFPAPRENLVAIGIEPVRDEDGAHHVVVILP